MLWDSYVLAGLLCGQAMIQKGDHYLDKLLCRQMFAQCTGRASDGLSVLES